MIKKQIEDEDLAIAIALKGSYIYKLPIKDQQSELFNIGYNFLDSDTEKMSKLENYCFIPYASVN